MKISNKMINNIISINVEVENIPTSCNQCYFKSLNTCILSKIKNKNKESNIILSNNENVNINNIKYIRKNNKCPLKIAIVKNLDNEDKMTFYNLSSYLLNVKDNMYQIIYNNYYGCFNELLKSLNTIKFDNYEDENNKKLIQLYSDFTSKMDKKVIFLRFNCNKNIYEFPGQSINYWEEYKQWYKRKYNINVRITESDDYAICYPHLIEFLNNKLRDYIIIELDELE